MNVNDQIEYACDLVSKLNVSNGFNAIGLSQGGLFMRGLLQVARAARFRASLIVVLALVGRDAQRRRR